MIEVKKLEPQMDGGVRIYPIQKSNGKYLGKDALGYANVEAAKRYMDYPGWETMCKELYGKVLTRDELVVQMYGNWPKIYAFERKVLNDWKRKCVDYQEKQVTIVLSDKK